MVYQCDICGTYFKDKNLLRRHTLDLHCENQAYGFLESDTFQLLGISYRNKDTGLLPCYECNCKYSDENANTLRRHVEGTHARNQTISIRTNVNPGEFVLPVSDIHPLPDATPITPTIIDSYSTTLNKMATMDYSSGVDDGGSTDPVHSNMPATPTIDAQSPNARIISLEDTPNQSSVASSVEDHTETTAIASSTDDHPIQLPTTSSILSRPRPMRKTEKKGSPLKEITALTVNSSSKSEDTGKNTCPSCDERFDHSLAYHRRVKHTSKTTIGVGPHRVEVERGKNGKFTCPICSVWDSMNPDKLRNHLPRCKEKQQSEDQQQSDDDGGGQTEQQTRQSRRIAQSRSTENCRMSAIGVPKADQKQLPPERRGDDDRDAVSGTESHKMDVDDEGPPQEGFDSDRGPYELPSMNANSNRSQTTRNPDSAASFDTQVEEDERDPSPTVTFILSKMNLRVVSIPSAHQGGLSHRFLVCTTCQMGLNPDNAVEHATSKDQFHRAHGIPVPLHQRKLMREWIATASDLHSPQNPPPIPDAHSPPVPGLKIWKGYRCPTCGLCKESDGMMNRHSSSTGHRQPKVASVQYFFPTREKNYFVVQPGRQQKKTKGHAEKAVDMYALYAKSFGLDIEEKLPFYHDDKEMPQLLQITRWFDHLWPYLRLREDDVEDDGDNDGSDSGSDSGDGLSEKEEDSSDEEGSDTGGEETTDEVYLDEDDGYKETRAGTKRKRHRPLAQPPPQKRQKGNRDIAWSGRMKVNFDDFLSDDDLMADGDEENDNLMVDSDEEHEGEDGNGEDGNDEEGNDRGKDDEDEDEGEGDDYDFVQLKNRCKISKKEQRRWSRWDTLTSVSKAKTLVSVRQPGTSAEEKACWYGTKLKDTISCYATSVGKEIRMLSSGFEIRRILGGNKPFWTPLSDPSKYATAFYQFVYSIAITSEGDHPSGYQFPLTSDDRANLRSLKKRLVKRCPKDCVAAFHKFIKPLLYPSESASISKWDDSVECFIALYSLDEDGTFKQPKNISPLFSILRYFIRCAIFREASAGEGNLLSAVTRETEKNFATCIMSPYKSSIEYHGLVKYLANHSTFAPNTQTSDDGMEITYKEVTLDVRLWRKGLEQLQKTATEAIDCVCYGRDFGLVNPVRVRDDWSNTRRAYTGFKPEKFLTHPLPLLDAMLHDEALGLASSPDGESIKFDLYKIQKQFVAFNNINKMLAILVFFLCGGPARLAEFCDGKFTNSHRPRGLFLDERGTVWYVIRRVKWENLVKREVFIPKKCPPELSDLLKRYLLIIRPVETRLSRHMHKKGTEIADLANHNYATFMWVRDGERVKSSTLGKDIADFLQNECGCEEGNPSSYRHCAVEMSRIFIEHVSFIDLAQQRGHSAKTAQNVYAIEADHLPTMSSDVLLHFGKMSELWWGLAGVGPDKELPVPFWMREERRRNELLELKSEVSELKKGLLRLERAVGQTGRKADEKTDDVKETLQMIYKLVNDLSGR